MEGPFMFGLALKFRAKSAPALVETVDGDALFLDGDALFEANVCELHDVAARVAALTSAVNAFAKGKPNRILMTCRNFIPSERTSLAVATGLQDVNSPEYVAGRHLNGLFGVIRPARELLETFFRGAGRHAVRIVTPRDRQTWAEAWQAASYVALKAVNALEPETRWRLSGLYSENSFVLTRVLRSAAVGETPCVDEMDCVTLPALPQQRRVPRFALRQDCTISHHGKTYKAFAKDVSAGGIGLAGAPAFQLKAEVEIQLRSGRRLSGYVVWCDENRLGVQFAEDLLPRDPLICGRWI
jgi:PilZ domain